MYTRIFLLVVAVLFLYGVSAKHIVSYETCKSEGGKLLWIDVTPCDKEPCILHKGTNVTCTVAFIPNEEVTSADVEVDGVISGVKIPFKKFDGCKSGMVCPAKSGQMAKIRLDLLVSTEYPSLKLVIHIDMKDQTKKLNFCADFPAQIQITMDDKYAKIRGNKNDIQHADKDY